MESIVVRDAGDGEMETAGRMFAEYIASIRHLAACSLEHQRADDEVNHLPGLYAAPRGTIALAWMGAECVGCAALRPLPTMGPDAGELKRMYVRPVVRGRGVGQRLTEHIVEFGRGVGYSRLFLDSDPELAAALRLYQRMGFVMTDRYNEDPDPTTVYMVLHLK
jgi:GNAT superfamily N-acetyltransferase